MNIIAQNSTSEKSDAASGRRSVMINSAYYNPSIILLGIIIISSLVGILTILG
jgi:hypothetical protein